MKTITPALDGHLQTEVTTLCTCWRVERRDGVTLGFTTLDTDLEYEGLIYESSNGFSRTAIAGNSDMSVDNLEVSGVIDSDQIDNDDLRNGLYDFARVFVFLLNYNDVTQGELPLRTGWFGEVSLSQTGKFTTELRGLNQALSHTSIELFTPECRADFCDTRCKLNAADFTSRGTVAQISGSRRDYFRAASLPEVAFNTSVGSHKVWGIKLLAVSDPLHGGFADVQFYDSDLAEIGGGDADATSNDKGHGADKARDRRASTNWSTSNDDVDDILGQVWYVEFDDAVEVREVAMTATANFPESPSRFALVYAGVDVNGDVGPFSEAQQFTMNWTKGGQSAVWGIGQTGTAPLTSDTGTVIPQPYEGASTYIGGTVTFRSGLNTGKSIEIIAVAGQWLTLFLGTPFPINVGDTFDIMQGCNKDRATCKLYDNIINFRGEPDVPGQDEFLRYPDAQSG